MSRNDPQQKYHQRKTIFYSWNPLKLSSPLPQNGPSLHFLQSRGKTRQISRMKMWCPNRTLEIVNNSFSVGGTTIPRLSLLLMTKRKWKNHRLLRIRYLPSPREHKGSSHLASGEGARPLSYSWSLKNKRVRQLKMSRRSLSLVNRLFLVLRKSFS